MAFGSNPQPATAYGSSDNQAEKEDESDDELFLDPPPALDDDEDDDEELDEDDSSRPAMAEESNSTLIGMGDGTYGSPRLREVFADNDSFADDDETGSGSKPSSVSRRNKRKNFKPRNIVAVEEDTPASEQPEPEVPSDEALNLSAELPNHRKSLLPRKLEKESSPMDLSVASEDEPPKLSVVRPEILFGERGNDKLNGGGDLSRLSSMLSGRPNPSDTMRDAFQEVLKLYGVPSDLAETIAKNAQNAGEFRLCTDKCSLARQRNISRCCIWPHELVGSFFNINPGEG